jgi:hypothetical protein
MDNQPREYSVKKQLMAGTALVAATMFIAGGAVAAEKKMMKPSISVNGYVDALVGGILDEEEGADTSAIDVRYDSEIHFNGRGTLDSGVKIHARAELEGQYGGGERIDEYFLSVSGSFGKIILGGTGGAPVKMLTGLSGSWATGVGDTHAFDSDNWVGSKAGNFGVIQHSRLDTGDAVKATYISPKFGGFQVGLTYSPSYGNNDPADGNVRVDAVNIAHDGIEGAVSYGGKFGDVGFGVGAGMTAYQGANDGGSDTSDWLVAARLDFGGGFRVSAAHKRTTNDNEATQGQLTDVGARYVQGANSFSLVGSVGEMDESGATYSAITGSYARALGPGVKVHMNLIWNESDDGGGTANSGVAAVSGVKVVF